MVNTSEFTARLKKIMEHHQLSASLFADKVGVQRSSISHLLSGRNKPSLDFVLKVIDAFGDVDLYWLLNGKGSFPKYNETNIAPAASLFENNQIENRKKIQRIVVFYDDGTFDEYKK